MTKNVNSPENSATRALPTRIQIPHHNMKHLRGAPGILLGNGYLWLAVGVSDLSIPSRDFRQPGATAANELRFLCESQAVVERPIGNLSRRHSCGGQRIGPSVFQRVGHNGFEDPAGMDQRHAEAASLECVPAIGVSLLDNGSELDVMNEVEAVRERRGHRRSRCALSITHA